MRYLSVDDVKQDCLFVNSGIIQRNQPCATTNIHEQTIMMKITVKESDLVLLEAPESSNSLALIAHITAVLNISDPHGFFGANLEIQVSFFGQTFSRNLSLSEKFHSLILFPLAIF